MCTNSGESRTGIIPETSVIISGQFDHDVKMLWQSDTPETMSG